MSSYSVHSEIIELCGILRGHTDWVTSVKVSPTDPSILFSSSRDKTVAVWKIKKTIKARWDKKQVTRWTGKLQKKLKGHSHFIESIDISSDGQYAISGSWDKSIRLWNLTKGVTQRIIKKHSRDVLSVAFSYDNRRIVSGSRDNTVCITNTVGQTKKQLKNHTNWVTSCVFSPCIDPPTHLLATASLDSSIKCYDIDDDYKLVQYYTGNKNKNGINAITISPDGTLLAAGGKNQIASLWDFSNGREISSLECGGEINAICFSPNRYWLCCCVGNSVKIFDLETKETVSVLNPNPNYPDPALKNKRLLTCLQWSSDGRTLFVGDSKNTICIWHIVT